MKRFRAVLLLLLPLFGNCLCSDDRPVVELQEWRATISFRGAREAGLADTYGQCEQEPSRPKAAKIVETQKIAVARACVEVCSKLHPHEGTQAWADRIWECEDSCKKSDKIEMACKTSKKPDPHAPDCLARWFQRNDVSPIRVTN